MKKSELLLRVAGLVGSLAVAGFVGDNVAEYLDQRTSKKEDRYPQTRLVQYYEADGQNYALLEHARRFGTRDMPGSYIKTERYSVPSNQVPRMVKGERIRSHSF
jgi:hypothetical protein